MRRAPRGGGCQQPVPSCAHARLRRVLRPRAPAQALTPSPPWPLPRRRRSGDPCSTVCSATATVAAHSEVCACCCALPSLPPSLDPSVIQSAGVCVCVCVFERGRVVRVPVCDSVRVYLWLRTAVPSFILTSRCTREQLGSLQSDHVWTDPSETAAAHGEGLCRGRSRALLCECDIQRVE